MIMRKTKNKTNNFKRKKKWRTANGRKSWSLRKKYLCSWLTFSSATVKNAQEKRWKDSDYLIQLKIRRKNTKELY